jgi:3-oxoacyl-[acyl-carrier protein] reductase
VQLELEGKSAIVTGGSLGIGRAIALELAREGANVAVNYRRHDDEAKAVVADIEEMGRKGLAVKADVSSYADAEAMVAKVRETFGRYDLLVCNAGITWDGVIWKMTEEQWDAVINVNLKGYFNYNKTAALHFKDQKYGKIVNISSINGIRGKFAQANYAASKGGEIAMTKSLAKELGKFNVNVNAVAPGMRQRGRARDGADRDDGKDPTRVQERGPRRDRGGSIRNTRGRCPPGVLSVLRPVAAHHRRGHQDRWRTVYLGVISYQ